MRSPTWPAPARPSELGIECRIETSKAQVPRGPTWVLGLPATGVQQEKVPHSGSRLPGSGQTRHPRDVTECHVRPVVTFIPQLGNQKSRGHCPWQSGAEPRPVLTGSTLDSSPGAAGERGQAPPASLLTGDSWGTQRVPVHVALWAGVTGELSPLGKCPPGLESGPRPPCCLPRAQGQLDRPRGPGTPPSQPPEALQFQEDSRLFQRPWQDSALCHSPKNRGKCERPSSLVGCAGKELSWPPS